jgi:hypothetical protein
MNLDNYNNWLGISENAFAWRYMDITKLRDMIAANNIYFARLDQFDDPLEGLELKIRSKLHFKNISKHEGGEDIVKQVASLPQNQVKTDHIKVWQQGIFASCWYLTEEKFSHHESLAMWQLYNSKFVIKVPFNSLLKLISETLAQKFSDPEITSSIYGKVEYLALYQDFLKGYKKEPMPALIKDRSFIHENEVRFLLLRNDIVTNPQKDRTGIKLNLIRPLRSADNDIGILCHPETDFEEYQNYKAEFAQLGFNLKYSELLTREVVKSLIAP